MADNKENPNKEAVELTPEEMVAKRAEITAYYEEHIPSLQIQLEYETLLRDIEKMRAERLQAQTFITRTMAEPPVGSGAVPPPPPPQNPVKAAPSPKRTLKKKENATN